MFDLFLAILGIPYVFQEYFYETQNEKDSQGIINLNRHVTAVDRSTWQELVTDERLEEDIRNDIYDDEEIFSFIKN